jgi:H3 lysine-79-specific histone-lysine N-methyltransferase
MPTYSHPVSFASDFRNLDDPNDKSWEPHPTDYPWAELEYPNNEASERSCATGPFLCRFSWIFIRFILLAPKDKDHYSPIMCLQKSLHTIVECG